jgi:hypothetical protein
MTFYFCVATGKETKVFTDQSQATAYCQANGASAYKYVSTEAQPALTLSTSS